MKTLLIDEETIKKESIIEKNVDSKILSKVIVNIQELYLKEILGDSLYKSLIDAVKLFMQSGTTLSQEYTVLLNDYVQPYLIHAVCADFIVMNNYKITNKGILKMNDNSASNASNDDVEYMKNYVDNYVGQYKKNLIEYLKTINQNQCSSSSTNIANEINSWYFIK
ncbi:MAG: hypothetical protein EOO46_01390 [Flavobacterium sp.]|nr:MAG: hypothetical protein EOO46_01390 [Flavobacterium sp.]